MPSYLIGRKSILLSFLVFDWPKIDDTFRFEAYPSGRMNQLVYAVAGGMEDWVSTVQANRMGYVQLSNASFGVLSSGPFHGLSGILFPFDVIIKDRRTRDPGTRVWRCANRRRTVAILGRRPCEKRTKFR